MKNLIIGILIGILFTGLPAQAINAWLEDRTIHCLFFACAVSGFLARKDNQDAVQEADMVAERMMEQSRSWRNK